MENYEVVYKTVEKMLSKERFYHSICTSKRAKEYAKIYNIDEEKAELVGLAHDIAKCLSKQEVSQYVEKYNIKLSESEKESLSLSHSKIGAVICRCEFGFDEQMCRAIEYHTTGKENMTTFEKIIFIADLTGEDRNFEGVEELYETAKKNIDEAVIQKIEKTIKSLLRRKLKIDIQTIKAYNYYIEKK